MALGLHGIKVLQFSQTLAFIVCLQGNHFDWFESVTAIKIGAESNDLSKSEVQIEVLK